MTKSDRDQMAHMIERYVMHGEVPGLFYVPDAYGILEPHPATEMVRSIDTLLEVMVKRLRKQYSYYEEITSFDRLMALHERLTICRMARLAHMAGQPVTLNTNGEGYPCKQDIEPGTWAVLSWEVDRLSEVIARPWIQLQSV